MSRLAATPAGQPALHAGACDIMLAITVHGADGGCESTHFVAISDGLGRKGRLPPVQMFDVYQVLSGGG